ncbi:MAG: 1-(5-phosphoribosyl)-5-[(5-phosphoribosylamino)methylideneamino]imidazole-4-carboxamide isomerase [Candidatus Fimenecus sp.]
MIIFPAIDIKDRECVRLYKGDFATAAKVAESYMDTALSFKKSGAQWIHMVDLNGALNGERINSEIFIDVAKNSGLKVEVGGGIRSMQDIAFYLEKGIERVIIGSAALKNPDLVKEACREYGDKIAVGIDAKDEMVATEGWTEKSNTHYIDLAKEMEQFGVKYIIFTDIDCDGMLSGPNLEQLVKLNDAVSCNITASGGIKDIRHIKALEAAELYGAICGRSLYSGTLSLSEAVKECEV